MINPLDGKTALGYFRTDVRAIQDFENIFGLNRSAFATKSFNELLERMLVPTMGPTPAHNAVFDDIRNESFENANVEEDGDMHIDGDDTDGFDGDDTVSGDEQEIIR